MKLNIKNVAVITNGLSPYRVDFYKKLHLLLSLSNTHFFIYSLTKKEPNRDWDYSLLKTEFTKLIYGFSLNFKNIYLHFNPFIIKTLKKDRIKLVIFTGSYITPTLLLVFLSRKFLNLSVIFWSESHLDEYRSYPKFVFFLREKYRSYIYNKFDGFIAPGERATNLINKYLIKNRPIHILPNTINDEFYKNESIKNSNKIDEISSNKKMNLKRINLFIVARLHKSKGLLEFIELIKYSKFKDLISIFIAGIGDLEHEIINKAAKNNIDLTLLGQIEAKELCEYLSICSYFVLPSLSDPSPLSVVEALWSSKPLLLSNRVGNLNEALDSGVNGFSFNVLNHSNIDIIDSALVKNNEWFDMAREKSFEIATTNFNSKLEANKLSEFIVSSVKGEL